MYWEGTASLVASPLRLGEHIKLCSEATSRENWDFMVIWSILFYAVSQSGPVDKLVSAGRGRQSFIQHNRLCLMVLPEASWLLMYKTVNILLVFLASQSHCFYSSSSDVSKMIILYVCINAAGNFWGPDVFIYIYIIMIIMMIMMYYVCSLVRIEVNLFMVT